MYANLRFVFKGSHLFTYQVLLSRYTERNVKNCTYVVLRIVATIYIALIYTLSSKGSVKFVHCRLCLDKERHQYSKTNVMHFLFNLLRIKNDMFRALLAHLQEALHKRHLVYCVQRRQEYAGPRADHDRAGPEYRYLNWYASANTDYV
jgi:ABC-type anion transport system duplicated permease subunit